MKHLILIAIVAGTACTCASAQLAFYTDEAGRKIYVQDNPKPEPKPVVPAPAAKTAKPNLKKAFLKKAVFAAPAPVANSKLDDVVEETAKRHSVDPRLVQAIIKTESNGSVRAVSNKGAMGLMQLMPATARDLGVTNTLDAAQNVDGGVRYLKYLMGLYGGDLELSLAAYNAGPGAVERHGGVPPYRETQAYVKKIGNLYGPLHVAPQTPAEVKASIMRIVDEDGRVVYTNTR